jgi:hypothetical protein
MSWADLPASLVADVCKHVAADPATSLGDVVSLGKVSQGTRAVCLQDELYAAAARRRWGPLDYEAYFTGSAQPEPHEWLQLHRELEAQFTPSLSRSIKRAISWLRSRRLLSGARAGDQHGHDRTCDAGHTHELRWLAFLIDGAPLQLRRRIASYVCVSSELFPKAHLDSFIAHFQFAPPTSSKVVRTQAAAVAGGSAGVDDHDDPLAVLRRVLLQFPFLPIDAGGGADRTIGSLARCYVEAVPAVSEWLGHAVAPDRASTVEAVHLVLYSLIMLNTDLHNPANVANRMTVAEYRESLYRVPLLRNLAPHHIARMHEAIKSEPLRIQAQAEGVNTIIRATLSDDADDEISPGQLSRYSRHLRLGPLSRRCCHGLGSHAGALVAQLQSAQGRTHLRFQLKRWQGRHYAELRALAVVAVLCCVLYELGCCAYWGATSGHSGSGGLSRDLMVSTARTAALATVLHVATRV